MSEQPGSNPYQPDPYGNQPQAGQPYGGQPYGGQPYGAQPPYGQGVPWGPPPDHPQATTVLILGILGLVLCQVVAPFAWIIGGRVKREIAESGGRMGGAQNVQIGWVLGIVGTAILGFGLLFFVGYLVFAVALIGSSV